MRYPRYQTQPNWGDLPSPEGMGPNDMLPSAHNPHYDVYNMSRGRYLGSLGESSAGATAADIPIADRGITDYPNELNALSERDDVQTNGIFDPPGSHGNVHPDDGLFADRQSLPGYLAREQIYAPSEVLDVNTGKPVMYVPGGGGIMLDPRTPEMMKEEYLYQPGMPSTGGHGVPDRWTVQPWGPSTPVPLQGFGQAEAPAPQGKSKGNVYFMAGVGGMAIGMLFAVVSS